MPAGITKSVSNNATAALLFCPDFERLHSVGSFQHLVSPLRPEKSCAWFDAREVSSSASRMVSVPPRGLRRAGAVSWERRQCASGRQEDLERLAPWPGSAVHLDPAPVLLDDAKDGGQAQPRAFAGFLGGEERFKDARQHVRRNSAAGVADAQTDIPARRGVGMGLG